MAMPDNILENLWKRSANPLSAAISRSTDSWNKEMKTLFQLGISMEETVRYLYIERPDLETFMEWIDNRRRNALHDEQDMTQNVLSAEGLEFWNENGYVIIKEAISKEDCDATRQAIWHFLQMDPDKKETWYNRHEEQRGLMLNFSDHETLNKNRFSPKIKKAYEQLYQTTAIHRTIDKVSFNPPETSNFRFMGSPLHWDTSLKLPVPFALQGLLYLSDCGKDDGAFHCVPGFHHKIEDWLNNLAPAEDPRKAAVQTLQPIPVTGNAGDFIIWQNTLPHCATANRQEWYNTSPICLMNLMLLPNGYNFVLRAFKK